MRKIKKIVALLISIVTILSLCTSQLAMPVGAAENDETAISDNELLLIEKLEALGVISNEIAPTSTATRREMAQIIAKYMSLPANGEATSSPFYDVAIDDKAIGAISGLYNMGVITGDENQNFHPDNNVTYDEALVFIINAIGHKMFAERSGGYPTGYHRIAIQHDMLDDISMSSGKDVVTVIDIYKMLNRALSAAAVETVYYGDGDVQYTLSATETFLSSTYGIRKYRGKITGNEFTRLTSPVSNLTDEQIEVKEYSTQKTHIYDTPGYVYGYLLGYTVDYYLNEDAELVYLEETPKANSTIKLDSEDILKNKTTADRIYYKDAEGKEYHIEFVSQINIDVIYNSQAYLGYGMIKNIIPEPGSGYIEALDSNNDGIYDVLFVYEYETVIVKNVDTYKEVIVDTITGAQIRLGDDYDEVRISDAATGRSKMLESITSGSVICVAKGKGTEKLINIYISSENIEGKIVGYNSEKGYEINGNYYKASQAYTGETLNVGLSGVFLLDMSGKIVTYEPIVNESTLLAVPAAIQYEEGKLDHTVTLRIFTSKGKIEDYILNDNIKIDNKSYNLSDSTEYIEAIKKICNDGYQSNGKYTINRAYVIKYTLNSDDKINYIDTGATGNTDNPIAGRLNKFADGYKHMRINYDKIVALCKSSTSVDEVERFYTRYTTDTIFFLTPRDGELGNFEEYIVKSNLEVNKWYSEKETYGTPNDELIEIQDITAYSLGVDDIRIANAMVLRGGGSANGVEVSGATPINIITHTSRAVNGDGMEAAKLYQGDVALGVFADEVSYATVDANDDVSEVDGDPILMAGADFLGDASPVKVGDIVQLGYDSDGYINAVKAITTFDNSGNIIPMFPDNGKKIQTRSLYYGVTNFAVATVEGVQNEDVVKNLQFEVGNVKGYTASLSYQPTVTIYYKDANKAVEGTIADVAVGDTVVLRLYTYFVCKDIIIIR